MYHQKDEVAWVGTGKIPVERYISEEYFEAERERVFKKSWLFAGKSTDIASEGEFLRKSYPVCHADIIITRCAGGALRAFHNVCKHRAAPVVNVRSGRSKSFTCLYHGWKYSAAGDLIGAPDQESYFDLDRKACGLSPVAVEEVGGLIFINLNPQPEYSARDGLGGLAEILEDHRLDRWTDAYQFSAKIPANWKCILDNFQETTHLRWVHSISLQDKSFGRDNPQGHPISIEFFGQHRMLGIWGETERTPTLVEGLAGKYGWVSSKGQGSTGNLLNRDPKWQEDLIAVFPSTTVQATAGLVAIIEVMPLAVDQSYFEMTIYLAPATSASERFGREYSVAAIRDIALEDVELLSSLQIGMKSGAIDGLIFQSAEAACRHSAEMVDRMVRGERDTTVEKGHVYA